MSDQNEAKLRRKELLADLLEGEAWQSVVVPTLVARLRELERRAMSAGTLEDLRIYQGGWKILETLLRTPHEFFQERES